MRAIIIDDKDARALLDQLKLEEFVSEKDVGRICERHGADRSLVRDIVDAVHGRFHYRVTMWLQEQGANTIR